MGLTQQTDFAKKTGICCTKAVIHDGSLPHDPAMQTIVNGVHAVTHNPTVMIEILAIRISADVCFWSALLRRDVTFIFLAC